MASLRRGEDLRRFALSRFTRLWPLHAAMLGMHLVLEVSSSSTRHTSGWSRRPAERVRRQAS